MFLMVCVNSFLKTSDEFFFDKKFETKMCLHKGGLAGGTVALKCLY